MQKIKLEEHLVRVVSAASESILIYIVYLYLANILRLSAINPLLMLVTGILAYCVNGVSLSEEKKNLKSMLVTFVGVLTAILFSAFTVKALIAAELAICSAVFLLAWYRGVESYYDYLYIYSINKFYSHTGIILFINILVQVFRTAIGVVPSLTTFSVLYILFGLYMLYEIKKGKYEKKIGAGKKVTFDTYVAVFLLVLTFVLSIPAVTQIALWPFKFLLSAAYPVLAKLIDILVTPIAFLLFYATEGLRKYMDKNYMNRRNKLFQDAGEAKHKNLSDIQDPESIKIITNALVVVLFVVAALVLIYLMYRLTKRLTLKKHELDYVEEKDFVVDLGGAKLKDIFANAGKKFKRLMNRAGLSFADNRERLRFEYLIFMEKLYRRGIYDSQSLTAEDISHSIVIKLPDLQENMSIITRMYEDVRYGMKMPEKNELAEFKSNITEVMKKLNASQWQHV